MENNTDDAKYIALICNGIFNSIPDISIGELFENYCDNVNYNVIKNEYGVYVDFTGKCLFDGQASKLMIRFKVDYEKNVFGIIFVKLNDSLLDEETSIEVLEDMAETSDVDMIEMDEFDDDDIYNDLTNSNEPFEDEYYESEFYDDDDEEEKDDDDDDDDEK